MAAPHRLSRRAQRLGEHPVHRRRRGGRPLGPGRTQAAGRARRRPALAQPRRPAADRPGLWPDRQKTAPAPAPGVQFLMRSATPTPRARASDSAAAAPRRPRGAPPVLRALGWLLRAGLALLLGAGVLLWDWAGSDTSLASALSQSAHYLPAGQRLERRGGRGPPPPCGGAGG